MSYQIKRSPYQGAQQILQRVNTLIQQDEIHFRQRDDFHRQRARVRADETNFRFRIRRLEFPRERGRANHVCRARVWILAIDDKAHETRGHF